VLLQKAQRAVERPAGGDSERALAFAAAQNGGLQGGRLVEVVRELNGRGYVAEERHVITQA
jgi:hypothetical protein